MNVTIQTVGLKRLAAKVDKRIYILSSTAMRQVLQEAGVDLVREFQSNIDAMTPGKVPDLKESTKKRKMKEVGFIYPILKRSGSMYDNMETKVVNSRTHGWTIQLRFAGQDPKGGVNRVKAEAHVAGRGHLPIRDFTTISRRWKTSLFQRIRDRMRRT